MELELLEVTAKNRNNIRALRDFLDGQYRNRDLRPAACPRLHVELEEVDVRFTPDFAFEERGARVYAVINLKSIDPPEEVIRTTLDISHFILSATGNDVPMRRLEYVSVPSDVVWSWSRRRQRTVERAVQTAQIIRALWDQI